MFSSTNPQGKLCAAFYLFNSSVLSQTVIWNPTHSLAVSVLERMLLLDPESRATAAEALTLPYFADFRDPEEETEAQLYDHSMDNANLPLSQWKRKDGGERVFKKLIIDAKWRGKGFFTYLCPAAPLALGHTFTEILTFQPVVAEAKETPL